MPSNPEESVPLAQEPAKQGPSTDAGQLRSLPSPIVFRKPDHLFSQVFFETKLAEFRRIIPTETNKDLVLWFKTLRGEFTAKRITQLNDTNLHLLVFKADATADEVIPFAEIVEIQIRHKDFVQTTN